VEIIYRRVAGLDLHLKTIVAAVRCVNDDGKLETDLRTFGTMTRDLLELAAWLAAHGVTHVAMEATGVLWKSVWNVLDGRFEELSLVNPRELKQVPGRKSDVKDAQWIAQLLQHGLLRSSFVPDRPQRELRDLTRHRAQLEGERTRAANRIHKLLEDANIKLGAVASEILGVSGRQAETPQDHQGEPLVATRADPSGLGGHSYQGQLSGRSVPSSGRPKRQETSAGGRGPQLVGDHLPHPQGRCRLS
jgi:transposase